MPLASLVPQAVLAPLDAADDPEAGSLKTAQANATKTFFPHAARPREHLSSASNCKKHTLGSQRNCPLPSRNMFLCSAGNAHLNAHLDAHQ